ncbi:MAG: DUF4365 domain-containing protein [Robiginitomaculum sp.]|nr:DUF4365 domain-containing protein [Robiginitomaculum sp.]
MNDTDQIARQGVNLLAHQIVKMGLIFREDTISDYGIDGQIEIKNEAQATGRLIAVQIKAGSSWLRKNTEKGFWYNISARHYSLWTEHSLPVIIILCDIENEVCYWELISKENCVSTGDNWKILVCRSNIIAPTDLSKLQDMASPIVAASDYTICSESDNSTGNAKRISLEIIAHPTSRSITKPTLAAIAREALQLGQNSEYARDAISAKVHTGKQADVVWGYVYMREIDRTSAAWVCRFQWISSKLDTEFQPTRIKGENIGNGLIIDWNTENILAKHLDSRRETKASFLAKVDNLIALLPPVQAMLEQINQQGELTAATRHFSQDANEFEQSWDDSNSPPQECQRLDQAIAELLAIIGNAGLIWCPTQSRTLKNTLSLSRSYHKKLVKNNSEISFLRDDIK